MRQSDLRRLARSGSSSKRRDALLRCSTRIELTLKRKGYQGEGLRELLNGYFQGLDSPMYRSLRKSLLQPRNRVAHEEYEPTQEVAEQAVLVTEQFFAALYPTAPRRVSRPLVAMGVAAVALFTLRGPIWTGINGVQPWLRERFEAAPRAVPVLRPPVPSVPEDIQRATGIVRGYYADLNSHGFDANRYFEPRTERYQSLHPTNPNAVNKYVESKLVRRYRSYEFRLVEGSMSRTPVPSQYVFVEASSYVETDQRMSSQRARVRLGLSPRGKMVHFHAYEIISRQDD